MLKTAALPRYERRLVETGLVQGRRPLKFVVCFTGMVGSYQRVCKKCCANKSNNVS